MQKIRFGRIIIFVLIVLFFGGIWGYLAAWMEREGIVSASEPSLLDVWLPVLMVIMLSTLLSAYYTAARRYPGENPLESMGRLSQSSFLLPFSLFALLFGTLAWLAQSLLLWEAFTYLIMVVQLVYIVTMMSLYRRWRRSKNVA